MKSRIKFFFIAYTLVIIGIATFSIAAPYFMNWHLEKPTVEFILEVFGTLINLTVLYYLINTFKEQQEVTKLQISNMEKEQKIHNYNVLREIFETLENDYKKNEIEFDNLIKYLNDSKNSKENKIKRLNNSSISLNYITHFINLGFDAIAMPLHQTDSRHLLIRYRHFGETYLSDFFMLIKALNLKKGELQLDPITFTLTWANLMTEVNKIINELLDATLKNIESKLVDGDITENYFNNLTIDISRRQSIIDLI